MVDSKPGSTSYRSNRYKPVSMASSESAGVSEGQEDSDVVEVSHVVPADITIVEEITIVDEVAIVEEVEDARVPAAHPEVTCLSSDRVPTGDTSRAAASSNLDISIECIGRAPVRNTGHAATSSKLDMSVECIDIIKGRASDSNTYHAATSSNLDMSVECIDLSKGRASDRNADGASAAGDLDISIEYIGLSCSSPTRHTQFEPWTRTVTNPPPRKLNPWSRTISTPPPRKLNPWSRTISTPPPKDLKPCHRTITTPATVRQPSDGLMFRVKSLRKAVKQARNQKPHPFAEALYWRRRRSSGSSLPKLATRPSSSHANGITTRIRSAGGKHKGKKCRLAGGVLIDRTGGRTNVLGTAFRPSYSDLLKTRLKRPIVIDGANIGYAHGQNNCFSPKGIRLALDHFKKLGHQCVVFLPHSYLEKATEEVKLSLMEMQSDGDLVFTPSRVVNNVRITSYDDRYVVMHATATGGVMLSKDRYRDVALENPQWKQTIDLRLLIPVFVGDTLLLPPDPLGRHGPPLEEFLTFPPSSTGS